MEQRAGVVAAGYAIWKLTHVKTTNNAGKETEYETDT